MTQHPEMQYLNALQMLRDQGSERVDRTKVGTAAMFGYMMRFDLQQGFPALTSKKVFVRQAWEEILWMLGGGRNIRPLLEKDVHIWSEWPHATYCKETGDKISLKEFEERILSDDAFAEKWGDLGPLYGVQWKAWPDGNGGVIDQVQKALDDIRINPTSRRIIIEGWNVAQLDKMALPPCHKSYQFFVDPEAHTLSSLLYQRSADSFLGLPFNLVNQALMTHMFAQQTGYNPGSIVWQGGDVHLYLNHLEQADLQLSRADDLRPFPTLNIKRKPDSLFDYTVDDFELIGYDPHPAIRAPVAV